MSIQHPDTDLTAIADTDFLALADAAAKVLEEMGVSPTFTDAAGTEILRIKNVHEFDGLHPLSIKVAKSIATGERLFSNGHLGVDILYMPPNGRFPLHTHPGDHLLFILEGTGSVTYGGVVYDTKPGDIYMVPGAVEHAVGAGPDGHKIMAFGAPHKHLDSEERMTVVEDGVPDDERAAAVVSAEVRQATHGDVTLDSTNGHSH